MTRMILLAGCVMGAVLMADRVATAQGIAYSHAQQVYRSYNAARMTTSGGGRLADSVRNRFWARSYKGIYSNQGWYQGRQSRWPFRYGWQWRR